MGIPAFIGAFIGGFGAGKVPSALLIFLAGLLVFWQGVELLARVKAQARAAQGAGAAAAERPPGYIALFTRNRMVLEGGAGLAVGLILGSIRLPALIRILRVDPRIAAGTNLFIGFIMGSLGWIGHVAQGEVNYPMLAMMGSGAMVGSYFGAKLTGKVNLNTLIGAMGLVLLGVGALLVFQAYRLWTAA